MTSAISAHGLTLRFPVYGVDNRSLKKYLARIRVGGQLASWRGTTMVTALRNVSLELKAGDRLGIIGSNGSGKTTLLRTLAGAYIPDEGNLTVQGRVASLLDLSMGLDPSATGLENIRLRCLMVGMPSQMIEEKLPQIAEFSGLGAFLAMPLKTYSAGMQARLAFAASTAVEADILLMDEWIAVGDAEFQGSAHERLTSLVEKTRILVLASHSPDIIRTFCNKVIRMDGGRAGPIMPVDQLDA
ncbi:sugar ABC transporter ATP-binding protein [Pseudomonas sp. HMWF010]|nr:sugar ABC transporter ATP-binding protein [Caulobacter sp. HMWF009]PTT12515.1 sugar ABC transporter ATP-binding protein [Caulobacter sp. HMWF025]PTT76649.1 sugar ABC transporter ATP-binding protein [Pseudomonas sp. HMWF010]